MNTMTHAVRLHGAGDLRLDYFQLPEIRDDEILARVVCDSLCTSTYKAAHLGSKHLRVPNNIAEQAVMVGHEFCGEIVSVGKSLQHEYVAGEKFTIQPALSYKDKLDAPGYSFPYIGGDATYIIIPHDVIAMNCFLRYEGASYFAGALAEPFSCVIAACKASYHVEYGSYNHSRGIRKNGSCAFLAGSGPMGLAAIEYIIHAEDRPAKLIITSSNQTKIAYIQKTFVQEAERAGIELHIVHDAESSTGSIPRETELRRMLMKLTDDGGYDDIFVMYPSRFLVELSDTLLARDGCMNFFAGPSDHEFSAEINFYNLHYKFTHFVATSGGSTADIQYALEMMQTGRIEPAVMISHIGGLNTVAETTLELPKLGGRKKLIYTHYDFPLVALDELEEKARGRDALASLYAGLAERIAPNNQWNQDAEDFFLQNAPILGKI